MTERERQAFDYVTDYWARRGYSPSYRQIMLHLGMRSTSGVVRVVKSLIKQGRLRRGAGHARSLEVVEVDVDTAVTALFQQFDAAEVLKAVLRAVNAGGAA